MCKIKTRNLLYFIILTLSFSCNRGTPEYLEKEMKEELNSLVRVEPGIVRLKLQSSVADTLQISTLRGLISTNNPELNQLIASLGVTTIKRTFPHAGKFEQRTRSKGLHQWYDVRFDTLRSITRAISDFSSLSGVELVEQLPRLRIQDTKAIREVVPPVDEDMAVVMPFNDPFLPKQWHYDNRAQVIDAIEEADINLFEAWKQTTGSSDITVAIVDGGVDVTHEDLLANMKLNETEYTGEVGVDDDGNGYIDDIYGYNFVTDNGIVNHHNHGTHVAGIVGAVNNNGIGTCGVAGGNGTSGSGVKMITCQIFDYDQNGKEIASGSIAEAIKYGADNGAIISQNSWGYELDIPLPESVKEAIDYFIEFAGVDEEGNQIGKMRGGIVIFAAGNYNRDRSTPASYEKVISVASMASDFCRANYSCYGTWVDLTAPGGSKPYGTKYKDGLSMVLSTLPNNSYGYLEGTSMACPHVSGIAALVLARYGGLDFTPEQLKERLFCNLGDIYARNPEWKGKLGAGYIDAVSALSEHDPPTVIKRIENHRFQSIGDSYKLCLDDYFDDLEEQPLSYAVTMKPDYLVEKVVENGNLYLKCLHSGQTTVKVIVSNVAGRSCSQTFKVFFEEDIPIVYPHPVVYPNPFIDRIKIRMPTEEAGLFSMTLVNMFGVKVFEKSFKVEAGIPLQLDLGSLRGGIYVMNSTFNGKSYIHNIVKQ